MNRPAGMVDEHLLRAAGGQRESSIARAPRDADRREKTQQLLPVPAGILAEEESLLEGPRKRGHVDRPREEGTGDLPEPCLGKVLAPEDLPASDGPAIGAEETAEFRMLRGEGSCRMAAAKKITPSRYTFRPRNRVEGGVTRLRQPSRSQHRLNR